MGVGVLPGKPAWGWSVPVPLQLTVGVPVVCKASSISRASSRTSCVCALSSKVGTKALRVSGPEHDWLPAWQVVSSGLVPHLWHLPTRILWQSRCPQVTCRAPAQGPCIRRSGVSCLMLLSCGRL